MGKVRPVARDVEITHLSSRKRVCTFPARASVDHLEYKRNIHLHVPFGFCTIIRRPETVISSSIPIVPSCFSS